MKTYPALALFSRHGRLLAYLMAIPGVFLGGYTWWLTHSAPMTAIVFVAVAVAMVATRLAAEVIEVLAETLIPR